MTDHESGEFVRSKMNPHLANRLLAALPQATLEALTPDLFVVPLARRESIYAPDVPAAHVYFPHFGMISVVASDVTGEGVEVATIGAEGMSGIPLVLGGQTMRNTAFVQISGRASRMEARRFQEAVETMTGLRRVLLRYTLAVMTEISQNAACNQLHAINKRCARWLLTAHDRVEGDTFDLTQEYLALMLGVTRPSVSAAASDLQSAGLISYSRGRLTIVDRGGLEQASCDCYRIIDDEFNRLRGL